MSGPFDAAIIHLKIYAGIKPVREGEKFSVGYGGIPPAPVRQQDIHAAIRVLEAAGKLSIDDPLAIGEYLKPLIDSMVELESDKWYEFGFRFKKSGEMDMLYCSSRPDKVKP